MKDFLLAERYAGALLGTIEDDARLDGIGQALNELVESITANHDLHTCLANPAITIEARERVLDEVLQKAGAPDEVKRLLHILLERGRIEWIETVAMVFEQLVDERLNRVTATVTAAHEISEANRRQIQEGLERFSGKQVRIKVQEDPGIIGGIIAEIEGTVIDGCLRSRVQRIKEQLIAQEISLDEIASN